jgi:signal transduction histidine kinase
VTAGAAGSVAVLAGVILVLLRVMYRRIAGSIAKLEEATANLGAGHLDQPVFMSGSDEVSGLAESFDRMRVALRDRLLDLSDTKARLEDANVHLEHRVLERTRQLEIALTQIRELDQAKRRFFANLSHELRTPLALILGPVDELLAVSGLALEWRHDLEVVRRNAQTLHTYVNDLLDLSRLDAGRMRLD